MHLVIDEKFVILGAVISVVGTFNYFVGTLKGNIRPNRVSWLFWALNAMVAFVAQLQQGVGLHALLTFSVGFSPALIFIASFFGRKAYWKLTSFDYACGAISLMGMILWLMVDRPNIAIACSIFADFMAGIPTIRKSITHPESEHYLPFFTSMISAFITILTIKIWRFEYYAFPVYIFAFCAMIVPIIVGGQRRLRISRP